VTAAPRRLGAGLAAACLTALAAWVAPAPASAVPEPSGSGAESPTGITSRLLVLRPNRVDLRLGARQWSVPRPPGEITLGALADTVADPRFLRQEGQGVLRLSAGLVQAPDTSLVVAGPDVRTLLLENGGGADGAYLQGSGASLALRHVTVRAAAVGRSIAAVPSRSRAFLRYRGGSQVSLSATELDAVGATRGHATGGLAVSGKSRLTIERSVVTGALTALTANDSAVVVEGLTVRGAAEDGVELQRGVSARVAGLEVTGSGRDGLVVRAGATLEQAGSLVLAANRRWGLFASQARDLRLGELAATGNGTPGVAAGGGIRLSDCQGCTLGRARLEGNAGQGLSAGGSRLRVDGALASANGGEGLDVSACTDCAVSGVTVTDNRTSGLVVRQSRDVDVTAVRAGGNDVSGVRLDSCSACTLDRSAVRGGATGIALAGSSTSVGVRQLRVSGSTTGVLVDSQVRDVEVAGTTVTGPRVGLDLAGRGLAMTDVTVVGATDTALRSDAPGLSVTGSHLAAAERAVQLDASGSVVDSRLRAGARGLVVNGLAHVSVTGSDIGVEGLGGVGVRAGEATVTTLTRTRVDAATPLAGPVRQGPGNQVPFAPDWLAIFAVAVVLAALLLELLRRARETAQDRTVPAPAHVSNTV
jgi:Right handed beta helix region